MSERLRPASSSPSPSAFRDEEETAFTIQVTEENSVEAVLHTVDPSADGYGSTGHTNLYFDVPARQSLEEGTYRVLHSRLGAFWVRLEEVKAGGREPDQSGYRAVVLP